MRRVFLRRAERSAGRGRAAELAANGGTDRAATDGAGPGACEDAGEDAHGGSGKGAEAGGAGGRENGDPGSGSRTGRESGDPGSGSRTGRVGAEGASAGGAGGEKYQRILDAAVEVIAENGYFHSPVSAIAARAGVADGTIYLYFKSKDDVLRTAIDTTFARFYEQVAEEFTRVDDPRAQLEYIARVHLESHAVNRSMAILMQTEMRQSAKFIAEFSHHHLVRYIQVVREVVRRGQQQGIFRADVSDGVVAHCMFGAIDELLSSAVFTGRMYDSKVTAAQVVDVLLNGITTGERHV